MRIRIRSAALAAFAFFASSCTESPATAPVAPAPSFFIASGAAVRISELHYDNGGTDAGERIELTGPANMSLAGWSVVLYNGSNGAAYGTRTLSALDAACGTRGVLVLEYPVNGIQNGSPDGLALVNAENVVVEFLSYEGTMTATDGPAAGMTSTDIGVSESGGGALGQSLKRTGLTTWESEGPENFGTCNYVEGAVAGEITSVTVTPDAATVFVGATQQLTGIATDADGIAGTPTLAWSSSDDAVATVSSAGLVTGVAPGTATITAATGDVQGSAVITVEEPATVPGGAVWISELHYDNASTDVGEAVEIEGPAGSSLAGWRIYLYNGGTNTVYSPTPTLTGTIPSQCGGRGTIHVPIVGIQNGNPDGVALVNAEGAVVEFISYGGTMTAGNGPAAGLTSTDIGVSESGTTAVGLSLQRKSGTWVGPLTATFGQCNGDAPAPPPTNRVVVFGRNAGDPDLPIGYEYQLFANYLIGDVVTPTTITWRSTNTAIVTVDGNGVVHAVAPGSARVEAQAEDGTVGGFTVRTAIPVASATADYLNSTEFGIPTDGDPSDDFLVTRPQYTSSYSRTRNTPNWVSWTLDASQFGDNDRCNCFTMDPLLPATFTHLTTANYTGAGTVAGFGIDRGHLARSFDRTGGSLDNATTFLLSNIVPQAADNNQGPWAALENELGARARSGTAVVYNIAGVAGAAGTLKNEGIVTIPAYVWKVAVIMPRGRGLADVDSHDDVEVIAVVMPNVAGIRNVPWQSYLVTVDSVEALSGYDLLARLRDDIERAVESNTVPPVAATDGPYSAILGEAIAMSGARSSDADGDALTYAWRFGDGASATGVATTHTYASAGTYSVRLIVTDPLGLADTVTTTARVDSWTTALQDAIALTDGLVAREAIGQGEGRALVAILQAAAKAVSADRRTVPVLVTKASEQLQRFVRTGHVSAADAAALGSLLERLGDVAGG